jgi:hypothetical protein
MLRMIDSRLITRIIHSKLAVIAILLLCSFSFPRLASHLETTHYLPGETPGTFFRVAVASGDASRPFKLAQFQEATQADASLYLQAARQEKPADFTIEKVHILTSNAQYTRIETQNSNDDYTFISRYRVEASRIEPESLRVFGLPQGLQGLLAALIATPLLFWILRKSFPRP